MRCFSVAEKLELPGGMVGCLARPEENIYAVNIIELNGGIDMQPDSPIKLIPLEIGMKTLPPNN